MRVGEVELCVETFGSEHDEPVLADWVVDVERPYAGSGSSLRRASDR